HYPSPLIDCGYDISDYCGIAPEYGTMPQFKHLLAEMHKRGMRLVLDLVLNHTSDQHAWFIEARSSITNPKRDWFVWKKGQNGQPPNDWFSTFGGSAWELDATTQEYYYHFFFKEQPDLNWENPEVKQAMFDMVRFWLDLGVDGFRLDAIGTIFEDPQWKSHDLDFDLDDLYQMNREAKTPEEMKNVARKWDQLFEGQHDLPEVHDLMRELRQVIDDYDDRVLIGETDDIAFYGNGQDELHLNFNFPLMRTNRLTAGHVSENQSVRMAALPADAWPCNTLGNHDCSRMYSLFGDGEHNDLIARQNLTLLLTLKGTPFLYNGEEIGMSDFEIDDPDAFRDPLSLRAMQLEMALMGSSRVDAVREGARQGRDKGRTPLAWTGAPNGGFCPPEIQPWLPVNPEYRNGVNVADQESDPKSLLNFYRSVIALRNSTLALVEGDYQQMNDLKEPLFGFFRATEGQRIQVLFNFSNIPVSLPSNNIFSSERLLFSTHALNSETSLNILQPYQVCVLRV
ncbi:MAG: alpha-glucosidase, partial [Anaerolineaceae bacterium]|nr:alpha-glucosidase [Anaerolineaceae bacterium]